MYHTVLPLDIIIVTCGRIIFANISGCNTSLNCSTDSVTVNMYVIPKTQVRAIDPTILVAMKVTQLSVGSWRSTFMLYSTQAPRGNIR